MAKRPNIEKAFPDEVLEGSAEGYPLPDFYSGPLYEGNGPAKAHKELAKIQRDFGTPDAEVDLASQLDDLSAPLN